MLAHRFLILVLGLGLSLLASCGSQDPTIDLGSFGDKKGDFLNIELDLPCLAARGDGDNTAELRVTGSGPFSHKRDSARSLFHSARVRTNSNR